MLEVNRLGRSSVHEDFLRRKEIQLLDPVAAPVGDLENVKGLSFEFFGEHCTECAAPDCHSTCDLFERGPTGLCRRFVAGIIVRKCRAGAFPYSLEVLFKPWGSLLAVGNTLCVGSRSYRALATAAALAGRIGCLLQSCYRFLPARTQWHVTDKLRGAGNRIPRFLNWLDSGKRSRKPTSLICILGNPHPEDVSIELSLSGFGDSQGGRVCRRTSVLAHGWHRIEIPIDDISPIIDLDGLFRICIVPLIQKPMLLQVLYVGFVSKATAKIQEPRSTVGASTKAKLVVVDLDNTLWDGVFVEDPDREIVLRSGVLQCIEELDRRGILWSIASKNNPQDIEKLLSKLGIWDYFLYPQIGWGPKSAGIRRITESLNIGLDSVVFLDDFAFEREEVGKALPEVNVLDDSVLPDLPGMEQFQVPVTDESRRRRLMYREETQRRSAIEVSDQDYDSFLASCGMQLVLLPLGDANRERVFELVQRTNQLNFSGNRYSRDSLTRLLSSEETTPVVMQCEDKFGDYGIVGFAVVSRSRETQRIEVTDMMFSCRIQGKKVEHSFLAYLVRQACLQEYGEVGCVFRRTARNEQAGRVLLDLDFSMTGEQDGSEKWTMPCGDAPGETYPASIVDKLDLSMRLDVGRNV
jgi:FkbH-like protein